MRLFGVIEQMRIATGINGEDFPGVTGGHKHRTVGPKREVPNVLGFGIKEDRLLSGGSYFVDFAIWRSGHV